MCGAWIVEQCATAVVSKTQMCRIPVHNFAISFSAAASILHFAYYCTHVEARLMVRGADC